jgi:hypothetical protein
MRQPYAETRRPDYEGRGVAVLLAVAAHLYAHQLPQLYVDACLGL